MSENVSAKKRDSNLSRSEAKEICDQGFIKGVVYGNGFPSASIFVKSKDCRHIHQGSILSLDVDGKKLTVTANQIDRDPVKRNIIHLNFLKLEEGKETTIEVPLLVTGELTGEGVLLNLKDTVLISAKPDDVPNSISIDISGLEVGETLTFSDISLPKGLTLKEEDQNQVILRCNHPQLEVVEEPVVEEVLEEAVAEIETTEDEEEIKKAS